MLPDQWHKIGEALFSDGINQFFTTAIFGVFLAALLAHAFGRNRSASSLSRAAPTVLTSLGVLGTFTGIFIGLIDFDVQNIDRSVPQLLAGLKLAFITSVIGMSTAIVFKLGQVFIPSRAVLEPEQVGAAEILQALKDIRDSNEKVGTRNSDALERLRTSISSDSDTSLVTQFQKLRTTMLDGLKETKSAIDAAADRQVAEFREFAKTVAENNSKALIEALQQVIRDFNQKITEQFGDNFKHLNEAVGRLLIWQEQYRGHVEVLTAQFEQALQGVEKSREAIQSIATEAASIPTTMRAFGDLMVAIKHEIEDLHRHLEAFQLLRHQAADAFPVIQKNIISITEGLDGAVRTMVGRIQETIDNQQQSLVAATESFTKVSNQSASALLQSLERHNKAHEEIQKGFGRLQDEAASAVTLLADGVDKTIAAGTKKLTEIADTHASSMQTAVTQFRKGFEDALKRNMEALGGQVEELDKQMQTELERAINVLGSKLASLSTKFVEDYAPLTERLRQLVNTARAM